MPASGRTATIRFLEQVPAGSELLSVFPGVADEGCRLSPAPRHRGPVNVRMHTRSRYPAIRSSLLRACPDRTPGAEAGGDLAVGEAVFVVTPLCQAGRTALFDRRSQPPGLSGGGVHADALVYGYTRHPAPLFSPDVSPCVPTRHGSRRSSNQLGPTTPAPRACARRRSSRSAVTRVTSSSAASATTSTNASSPLPLACSTVTPPDCTAGAPARAFPSRTTTTGGVIRPESAADRSWPTKVRAAPARSRHQPVGRDPMTLAASTRSISALRSRPAIDQIEIRHVVAAVI
jgi:hypothetical protein